MTKTALSTILSLLGPALLLALAEPARPCGTGVPGPPLSFGPGSLPGLPPPPPGKLQTVASAQIGLFAPGATTTCTCGIGLGGAGATLPPSLLVQGVTFTRLNVKTGQHTPLGELSALQPNPVTSAALGTGPTAVPGAQWFGFSGPVEPFTTPLLGPDEVFTMSYLLAVDEEDLSELRGLPLQFAGGVGDAAGVPLFGSREEHPVTFFASGELPSCLPSEQALCLTDGRFRVEVDWRDFAGNSGPANAVPCSSQDSGLFTFFDPENWELQVKVLDACSELLPHFWVFAAATTNVQYTLTVTDTVTGQERSYFNPLGRAAEAITDTSAFATCP